MFISFWQDTSFQFSKYKNKIKYLQCSTICLLYKIELVIDHLHFIHLLYDLCKREVISRKTSSLHGIVRPPIG